MFSTDTKQLQMFLNFMNNVALAPIQIIVALVSINTFFENLLMHASPTSTQTL